MEVGKHPRREVTNQHIAERSSAQCRKDRHQQNAEDIRSLVNGNHRAGNSEGRRADGFTELKDCVKIIHGRSLFQI